MRKYSILDIGIQACTVKYMLWIIKYVLVFLENLLRRLKKTVTLIKAEKIVNGGGHAFFSL